MSKVTVKVSGEVGSGKSAVCDKLEQFLKILGVNVEWLGGAEERNLGICALPKEVSVEILEEHSIDRIVNLAPVGFMMIHKRGADRGFSWVKDDIQFSKDWERVALFDEEQLADLNQRLAQAEDRVKELEAAAAQKKGEATPSKLKFARYEAFEEAGRIVDAQMEGFKALIGESTEQAGSKVWGASTMDDLNSALEGAHELSGPPHERIRELIRQRDEYRGKCAVINADDDPVSLWAEIHKLRAELQGPDGHATWKDAAIAERATAAKRILKWRDTFDAMHQRAMRAEKTIDEMAGTASVRVAQALEEFKEALHTHFNTYEIAQRLGIVAIMMDIDKVFEESKS